MPADGEVKLALARFECVEWQYDGMNGKVIAWTKAHGNTSDDPSELAWVLNAKEDVVAEPGSALYSAGAFVEFLNAAADDFDKGAGKAAREMKVHFDDGALDEEGGALTVKGLKAAKEGNMPAILYFVIPAEYEKDKKFKEEAKRCRKLEGVALGDDKVAEATERFVCWKLDFTQEKVRKLAADYKLKEAPALVILDWKSKSPKTITSSVITAKELLEALKKALPKEKPEEEKKP